MKFGFERSAKGSEEEEKEEEERIQNFIRERRKPRHPPELNKNAGNTNVCIMIRTKSE